MSKASPLFLDTTIQVDRVFKGMDPATQSRIDELLSQFDLTFVCTFSQLEFKRVVLQSLSLALRYLTEENSFFSALHRATALRDRKAKALVNILSWVGFKTNEATVVAGTAMDQQLKMRAESYIRTNILFLWHRFRARMEIADGTKCQRAAEVPVRMRNGNVDVTIHESLCQDKQCSNDTFFQSQLRHVRKLCNELDRMKDSGMNLSNELNEALEMMKNALKNRGILQNYQNCLRIGDVWIHLESLAAGVNDFATTNYKESEILCPILGLEMHSP